MINYFRILIKWFKILENYDPNADPDQILTNNGVDVAKDAREVMVPLAFAVLLLWFELVSIYIY